MDTSFANSADRANSLGTYPDPIWRRWAQILGTKI